MRGRERDREECRAEMERERLDQSCVLDTERLAHARSCDALSRLSVMCMYVRHRQYIYVHIDTYIRIYIRVCIYIYTYVYAYVCVCVCVSQ